MIKHASFQVLSSTMVERDAVAPSLIRTAHRAVFQYEPKPGFLYVRSRAISSRTNDNYDEFPPEEIAAGYMSFVGKPVFVNHKNDDHRRARGVIVDAVLHRDANRDGSPDTWVEVLQEVDAVRFPKLAEAIIKGEIDRTSMGVDVAYSVCTFCGNKAATPLEYCAHIPRLKGKRIRRTTASGEAQDILVAERCYGLSFFENSLLVEQPADPTAYFLGVDASGLQTKASNALQMTAGVGSDRHWEPGWSDDVDTDYAKQVRKRPGWTLLDEDHAQVEHGGIRATVRPTSDGERHHVDLTHDSHRIYDLNRFGNTWSTPKAAMDAAEKYIDKHRPGWRDSTHPPSEEFYAGDDAKQRWQKRHIGARDPEYDSGGDYSRYKRVVPSGEEVAAHMKRHGRQPATYRYECKECGRRVWGSGLGIGSHNRWHARQGHVAYNEIIAPPKVDTLRDPDCPVCGDDSYNGNDCPVCGFTKPPDMFMDPDTDVAKQQDLRQQREDASSASNPAASPSGYVPPSVNGGAGAASGYVPPTTNAGKYVPPKTSRRQLVGAR